MLALREASYTAYGKPFKMIRRDTTGYYENGKRARMQLETYEWQVRCPNVWAHPSPNTEHGKIHPVIVRT